METNENPPILVTSDVKFAVMKDGTVITDKEVDEGPGWLDIAIAISKFIDAMDEHQFIPYSMADMLILRPAIKTKGERLLKVLEKKKKAQESDE